MKSIAFPNMFNQLNTQVLTDEEATLSNLKLLIKSYKGEFLGDPYYGNNLMKVLFSQNTAILKDLIVDDIYTAIQTFMPQLKVPRQNIEVVTDSIHLYVNITALNMINYTTNLYQIKLTEGEES